MSDDGPPSSQPASRVFFYQPDVRIPVFVEASSIRNRPKLIRSLRNCGAYICHDPAEAHVILVDSSTDAGTQFIRDWGTDSAKVVLEYSWARKCIDAGRPLLQNDNWGDCVAYDDGRSISNTNDREVIIKSPLPTPRPTPSDAEPSLTTSDPSQLVCSKPDPEAQAGNGDAQFKDFEPSSSRSASQARQTPQAPPNIQLQQSQQNSPSYMPQSQPFPFPPSQAQQPSYPQQAQQVQQFQSQPYPQQYAQSQKSAFSSNAGNQFVNPFLMNQAPQMQQFPQIQPGQSVIYPQQMVQNYMGQPNGQQNAPFDAQMFLANFMDIARQQGFQMPLGVPQQMTNTMMQQMFQSQQFSNTVMPQSGQGQSISSSFPNSFANDKTSNGSSHPSASAAPHSPSPQVCAPSIRRRSSPLSTPSPPPPQLSKGKGKAVAPSFKRKRSEPSDESSEEDFVTPPRLLETNAQVLFPRKLGEIFRSDSGEPLLFFMQVDLMGRYAAVQHIKKHGGKMIGNINDADYVVLGNTTSKTFPDLLAQTTAADKLPLRSAFISDCVKHEALLDDSDYILEDFIPQPKKRGRPGMAIAKAETPKKKVPKEKKPPKKSDEQMAPISYDGPPSPTPPPVSSRVELPSGYFRFSEEDIAFFRLYARHLVEQDHLISNTSLFKRLHEKMPHHSSTSWQQHIRRCFPDDLDNIRKKVGIARRKAADQMEVQDEAGPSKRAKLSDPVVDGGMPGIEAIVHQDLREEDFHDICQFFATGGGENSDDEAVWASLTSRQPCRSAASWPDYYQGREKEIVDEIERLIEEAIASEAGGKIDVK